MSTDEKIKVVFMPYKISMWDSLESVYECAVKDKNCEVQVVPIPYYEKHNNNKFIYEGNKFREVGINITHYDDFYFNKELVDVIFIHNVYDEYNAITQIDRRFFTSELKKISDKLVYIPYYIPTPLVYKNDLYSLNGIDNVDKIILAGEFAAKTCEIMGTPKEKILTLGSPKFDSIIKKIKAKDKFIEWDEEIKGNKVILLNTGCMHFCNDPIGGHIHIDRVFSIARYIENVVIIWRPHPLTESSIKKYNPQFLETYRLICEEIRNKSSHYPNVILDETSDYMNSISKADLLISNYSSILNAFLATYKPIVLLTSENSKQSLITDEYFYYFYDKNESWYKFFYRFIKEDYDPLKDKRNDIVNELYKNINNKCGEKVMHNIKLDILSKKNKKGK